MADPFPPGGRLLILVIAPDGTQSVAEIHHWNMTRRRHVERDGGMPTLADLMNTATQVTITGQIGDIEIEAPTPTQQLESPAVASEWIRVNP